MSDVIRDLCDVILSRRESAGENSYTAYLFREGLDKILKKIAEESGEVIIAAKSLEAARTNSAYAAGATPNDFTEERRADLTNEVADLVYHILVMLAERGVAWDDVEDILTERAGAPGNLKTFKKVDKDT
jgi:phosphoribosyl-ATP pyrophosphohydrolase